MNILFLHQNFPGQFRHLAAHLAADPHNRVVAICQPQAPRLASVPNTIVYQPPRVDASGIHPYLRGLEGAVRNGQAVARVLLQLRARGYIPDIVVAHPAWGEALYVKDIYPDTRLVNLCEFYYHATGADADFDPEYPLSLDARTRLRTRNALQLLNLEACDAGVSPTEWQRIVHPPQFRSAITVIHEGIDTGIAVPDPQAAFALPDGTGLAHGEEIVTYVARNLEPYRGFHHFMRAAQLICRRRPKARILIVGGDDVSYGQRLPAGQTYRQKMLEEVPIDAQRVHFLGRLPYDRYLTLLQVSAVHVYLTVPFVLSWSMLEAMSAGCLVIGSDTAPVREVLRDGENGLLVDFFSPPAIAERVDQVLDHADRMQKLRLAARRTIVDDYNVKDSIEHYERLIASLCGGAAQGGSAAAPSQNGADT